MSGAASAESGRTPADAFLARARAHPDAIALVGRDGETNYGELLALAGAERRRVAALGLPPGEPVAVEATKTPATLALLLACQLERRPVLLTSQSLGADVRAALHEQAAARHVLEPGAADGGAGAAPTGGAEAPDGTPLLLLTTSGSTGTPKIVPLTADAITAFTRWAAGHFGIGPGTTVLNHAPLNFDLCLLDVWTTLAHGGRIVLVDPDRATRGRYLLDQVVRHRPEIVQAVPMFYRLLADAADRDGTTLPGVRHAVFTGDSMPVPLLGRLPALLPGARLSNLYGCTETNDSFLHEVVDLTVPAPLGRPLPGVQALVVTPDGRVLDGPGSGELYVSTPFQSPGYLDARARGAAFVPDPRGTTDGRFFRSGDLVHRDADGRHTLLGRTDFQVKVRGVRVNPQEVEHVLLAHPGVAEAAVLARPDPVAGHLLHAVVRRTGGSGLDSLVLRGHLARGLSRAAVPATVRITDEPLPRTSTGKVDRDRVPVAAPEPTHRPSKES
ncbi:class I adenylate-forming enzyme family protein [Streptomyces sp. NPDC059524]|uniref:class I adenylate-forming enzyme family protein n=1 Tax=Streptomyces sp. NPDC059524 TaxID=3346856 RepID=UPI0036BDE77B